MQFRVRTLHTDTMTPKQGGWLHPFYSTFILVVGGPFVGTIAFEGAQEDEKHWFPVKARDVITGGTVTGTDHPGTWIIDGSQWFTVRARVDEVRYGTINVRAILISEDDSPRIGGQVHD